MGDFRHAEQLFARKRTRSERYIVGCEIGSKRDTTGIFLISVLVDSEDANFVHCWALGN